MAENQRSVSPVILIVGGVAIVAAALYALWAFVLSGNSTSPTDTASAVPSAAAPSASAGTDGAQSSEGTQATEGEGGVDDGATPAPGEDPSEASDDVSQVLPETFEVYTARNPFEQLIKPAEDRGSSNGGTSAGFGSGSGTSGSAPIGSTPGAGSSPSLGSGVGTTRPNTPVAANPSAPGTTPISANSPSSQPSAAAAGGTSTSAGTGAGGQVEVGATRVRLQSVGADNKAVVTVNGVDYNPTVGEQFAQRFKLLSVNKSSGKDCATMLFGDSRFSICAGQVIDK